MYIITSHVLFSIQIVNVLRMFLNKQKLFKNYLAIYNSFLYHFFLNQILIYYLNKKYHIQYLVQTKFLKFHIIISLRTSIYI